jgi:4-oxalocrotonate tautomerase
MPFINVKMVQGFSREQKDELIKAITGATSEILKLEPPKIRVVIDEYSPDDWAVGGIKMSQMKK